MVFWVNNDADTRKESIARYPMTEIVPCLHKNIVYGGTWCVTPEGLPDGSKGYSVGASCPDCNLRISANSWKEFYAKLSAWNEMNNPALLADNKSMEGKAGKE